MWSLGTEISAWVLGFMKLPARCTLFVPFLVEKGMRKGVILSLASSSSDALGHDYSWLVGKTSLVAPCLRDNWCPACGGRTIK